MDVNDEEPRYKLPIDRVGVEGISIPFYTFVGGHKINSTLTIDAYINLPPSMRGIHASRSLESIQEVIYEFRDKFMKVEEIASSISRELLIRHQYSTRSLVNVWGDIVLQVDTPVSMKSSLERFRIYGRAVCTNEVGELRCRKFVGVRVTGLTVCPSAQKSTFEQLKDIPRELSPTHIQRGYLTILVEEPEEVNYDILDLINIATDSFSSPTYELLKKEDEAKVVIEAYRKPMFTEDVVRRATSLLLELIGRDSDLELYVSYKSLESIHSHNLVAVIRGKASILSKYL